MNKNLRFSIYSNFSKAFVRYDSIDKKLFMIRVMASRPIAISWTNDDPIYWHVYP